MRAIEKVSVTDLVVKEIEEMCFSEDLTIGDKLPTEKELCDTLNVGRSTVREALRVVQAMGVIEMRPGKGAYLKSKTKRDDHTSIAEWFREHKIELQDFIEVRLSLEPLAARLACERASDEEVAEIVEVQRNFEQAQKERDVVKLAIADEALHDAIARATHNTLLIIVNKNVADAFAEYRTKSFAEESTAGNALEPHRAIVEAINGRDADRAEREMRRHIEISLRDIEAVVRNS